MYMHVYECMRQAMVESAGFEVFDAFGVTLHAPPEWFDDVRYGVKYKLHGVHMPRVHMPRVRMHRVHVHGSVHGHVSAPRWPRWRTTLVHGHV